MQLVSTDRWLVTTSCVGQGQAAPYLFDGPVDVKAVRASARRY
jgi:hypothetical protein